MASYSIPSLWQTKVFCWNGKLKNSLNMATLVYFFSDENHQRWSLDTNLWTSISETLFNYMWNSHWHLQNTEQKLSCFTNCPSICKSLVQYAPLKHYQAVLNFCMLGNFWCFCCRLLTFQNLLFQNKSFRNTIRVSNGLDPDQERHFVCPDLGPNCLQRLSADDDCHG